MSRDYLDRLIAVAQGMAPVVEPLLPARFEQPMPAAAAFDIREEEHEALMAAPRVGPIVRSASVPRSNDMAGSDALPHRDAGRPRSDHAVSSPTDGAAPRPRPGIEPRAQFAPPTGSAQSNAGVVTPKTAAPSLDPPGLMSAKPGRRPDARRNTEAPPHAPIIASERRAAPPAAITAALPPVQRSDSPPLTIRIERIEITAPPSRSAADAARREEAAPASPHSLDDYLARRRRGGW